MADAYSALLSALQATSAAAPQAQPTGAVPGTGGMMLPPPKDTGNTMLAGKKNPKRTANDSRFVTVSQPIDNQGWFNPNYDPLGPKDQRVPNHPVTRSPQVFYMGASSADPSNTPAAGTGENPSVFGDYENEGKMHLNPEQRAAANWYDRKVQNALVYGPAGYSNAIKENLGTDDQTIGYGDDPQQYRSGMTGGNGVDIGTVGPSDYTPVVTPSEDYEIGESNIGAPPSDKFPTFGGVDPKFPRLSEKELRQKARKLDKKYDASVLGRVSRYERQNDEPVKADFGTLREFLEARLQWQRGRARVANQKKNKVSEALKGK